MSLLAVPLAALAAAANATGDVLQRSSARHETSNLRGSVSMLFRLLRRPAWLGGIAASLLGLAIHVGALSLGELATVQPILVAELPLAVLGAALVFGRRPPLRDVVAIVVLAVGLALFVISLAPREGARLSVPGGVWAVGVILVGVLVALLAAAGWCSGPELRGGLLAAGAGVGYGLTGVFFAVAGETARTEGTVAALVTWQTYGALASGGVAFYLLQNALAAGSLLVVEPGLTLANPLVAVLWGVLVFGEQVRGGRASVGAAVGAVMLVGGVVLLARSPVLQHGPPRRGRRTRRTLRVSGA